MDDEYKPQENGDVVSSVNGLMHDGNKVARSYCGNDMESPSLCDALKLCLLKYAMNGIDKVLIDRKRWKNHPLVNIHNGQVLLGENGIVESSHQECGESSVEKRRGKNNATLQQNKWRSGIKDSSDVLQILNSPSQAYNQFLFNFFAFFSMLLMKFILFQFNLIVSFFTFPIWLSNFSLTFLMHPFQNLRHIRGYFMKKLLRFLCVSTRKVGDKAQKSMRNKAFRLGCAFFWSSYVFLLLSGLLASGFAFSGLMMRIIAGKPVQTTQILNFDYTKSHPVAYVPILPYSGLVHNSKEVGGPVIPRNHKLQLTVSLTMPESEYNRQLGNFQVRVELVTATGKVRASSSKPCMLQFESNPIRIVETVIKSVSVIAGFGSESQAAIIKMKELTQGLEPTEYLKVIIESRAEYKFGAGIPEPYGASLSLESDIPQSKRLMWNWRRTIFVWTSFLMFFTELIFISLFFKPIIIPRKTSSGLCQEGNSLH